MFRDEEVIGFCLRYRITVSQYYLLYLVARKDFHKTYEESLAKRYLKEIQKFEHADMLDLVDKEFLENMNSPGESLPELFMLKEHAFKLFIDEDMGEDLWEKYPPTFPLSGGQSFLARAGGDKNEILADYRRRIDYSAPKHFHVMKKLGIYIGLVKAGKLNGHKISDWIKMQVWESIEDLEKETEGGGFGTDI